MEVNGEQHASAVLPTGKSLPVYIRYEAGRDPEPGWMLWRREKSCQVGNWTRVVQPVARRYTDRAIPTRKELERIYKNLHKEISLDIKFSLMSLGVLLSYDKSWRWAMSNARLLTSCALRNACVMPGVRGQPFVAQISEFFSTSVPHTHTHTHTHVLWHVTPFLGNAQHTDTKQ
jgi:hypothetical protein